MVDALASVAAAAALTLVELVDFSAWPVLFEATAVVPSYLVQGFSLACLYCIRVLSVMVVIALNFHSSDDSSASAAKHCQPTFDCLGAAVWLGCAVNHCHYSNEHFVDLM